MHNLFFLSHTVIKPSFKLQSTTDARNVQSELFSCKNKLLHCHYPYKGFSENKRPPLKALFSCLEQCLKKLGCLMPNCSPEGLEKYLSNKFVAVNRFFISLNQNHNNLQSQHTIPRTVYEATSLWDSCCYMNVGEACNWALRAKLHISVFLLNSHVLQAGEIRRHQYTTLQEAGPCNTAAILSQSDTAPTAQSKFFWPPWHLWKAEMWDIKFKCWIAHCAPLSAQYLQRVLIPDHPFQDTNIDRLTVRSTHCTIAPSYPPRRWSVLAITELSSCNTELLCGSEITMME